MFCINCLNQETIVSNSRPSKKTPQVWRRRTCPTCGYRFTTDEMPRLTDWPVASRSATSTTPFNPGKLLLSIANAFAHDHTKGADAAWALTHTVVAQLALGAQTPLTAEHIRATTREVLDRFDQTAAAQYALSHHMITSLRRRGRPSFGASPASPSPGRQA